MSKNTRIVATTTVVLAFAVTVLGWLNRDHIAGRKALQESGAFLVTAGEQQYSVTMDDLLEIGSSTVDANYKTNLMPAIKKQYTGVSLKNLFDFLQMNDSSAKSVSFLALDGHVSAVSMSDALDEENCFIVFEEAGKQLGTRESGGTGPYMVIFAKDRFSQRWCKYLFEITIS